MIRPMQTGDYPQVLELWQACFGDEESYIRFFWENGFPRCRGLVWEERGRAVSMLFLLPGVLEYGKTALPADYVYAVATLPAFRSRGFAAALAREAARTAPAAGKSALCLRPGSESLYNYYAKLGYVKAFARYEKEHRGGFAWEECMRVYIEQEAVLTGRELTYPPGQAPGGMLLPLDAAARRWLQKTKGRAKMGPALE